MLRERHQQRTCEADSIEALPRGGQARSSDGCRNGSGAKGLGHSATDKRPTARQEEPLKVAKPFCGLSDRSRMS